MGNRGDAGTDTIDLTVGSVYPVSLLTADGSAPLPDTNGNGLPDTGPLTYGQTCTATARILTPAGIASGHGETITVTAHSFLTPSHTADLDLRLAVPAPFAQAYIALPSPSTPDLSLHDARGRITRTIVPNADWMWNDLALARTTAGFAYVWGRLRYLGNSQDVWEIEYRMVDGHGEPRGSIRKLADLSALPGVKEGWPAMAAGTDATGLSPASAPVLGDHSSRTSRSWTRLETRWSARSPFPGTSSARSPALVATRANRYVLAWTTAVSDNTEDIYYSVRDSKGLTLKPPARHAARGSSSRGPRWYPLLLSGKTARCWYGTTTAAASFACLCSIGPGMRCPARTHGCSRRNRSAHKYAPSS